MTPAARAATAAAIAAARAAGRRALDERTAKRVLNTWGIAAPKGRLIGKEEAIAPALRGLLPPFALKLVSPELLHKSDVGGVALHLPDDTAIEAARRSMLQSPALAGRAVDEFLIEEMAPAGHELVIGGTRDRLFGPVVMLGLGGLFVEILGDVSFRVCPISPDDAMEMMSELRGGALLDGARGGIVADREAVIDALLRIAGPGGLLTSFADEIAELDINPLIASRIGVMAADARIVLAEQPASATQGDGRGAQNSVLDRFAPLFMPRNVAVLGASTSGAGPASNLIRQLSESGFTGPIYPIHPTAGAIDGRRAYRSLGELPEPVDYAFVAIAAKNVPAALRVGAGRACFAQVMSSGFGESADGRALEAELTAAARETGIRVLGPNCLGTYSPRGRLTFTDGMSGRLGPVGIISQSGGLALDTLKRGQRRGLSFSGVVTIGNCADVGASDLMEFFLADEETRVVGLYLEEAKDGRRLFELMAAAQTAKPIVLLRGGRTRQGGRAAVSHTGALASDDRVWAALARQTGTALVDTLDQFLDALLAFQLLALRPDRPTRRVALFGNGGGTSVLAADFFGRHGFEVAPFGDRTMTALRHFDLPAGSSIVNPIDIPANILRRDGTRAEAILDAIHAGGEVDAVVMHINMPVVLGYRDADILGNLIAAALAAGRSHPGTAHSILVLRSDGEPEIEARKQSYRERALAAGIPVYNEVHEAALALAALRTVESWRANRRRNAA